MGIDATAAPFNMSVSVHEYVFAAKVLEATPMVMVPEAAPLDGVACNQPQLAVVGNAVV